MSQTYHIGSHCRVRRGRSQGGIQVNPAILWHTFGGQVVTHLGVIRKTNCHVSSIGS